jgi:hypothetical protein
VREGFGIKRRPKERESGFWGECDREFMMWMFATAAAAFTANSFWDEVLFTSRAALIFLLPFLCSSFPLSQIRLLLSRRLE